jgi:AraC-like DNA-binding protein
VHFCSYRPEDPLGRFVDFFWMITNGAAGRRERIFPSGTSELVINLCEDEVRIYDSVHPDEYQRLSGAVFAGVYSRGFICDAKQHQSMIGVHFRPGGAFPFLGIAATELTDSHANLEDLWGRQAAELRSKPCEAHTVRDRFQILHEVLINRIHPVPNQYPAVEFALRQFDTVGRCSSIRQVAAELGLSQRRFIELFAIQVGLTPKLLCRILRFQRARALATRNGGLQSAAGECEPAPEIEWADIAIACGYYDQAHFINDFRSLSGVSPSEYVQLFRPAQGLKDNHLPLSR